MRMWSMGTTPLLAGMQNCTTTLEINLSVSQKIGNRRQTPTNQLTSRSTCLSNEWMGITNSGMDEQLLTEMQITEKPIPAWMRTHRSRISALPEGPVSIFLTGSCSFSNVIQEWLVLTPCNSSTSRPSYTSKMPPYTTGILAQLCSQQLYSK